ncbi:MAG: transcriptional repressor [Actinomycetota bacterium]|nr:transcriptional repressor [Actinomycetota bacterium]
MTNENVGRNTRQRAELERALRDAGGFRSAQELHGQLRGSGSKIGLTTVYRNLQALSESGAVDVLPSGEGESIYRLCATEGHHHHLVCRSCGTSVEIASDEVEQWAERTARAHGFTGVTHTAELYGLCGRCS